MYHPIDPNFQPDIQVETFRICKWQGIDLKNTPEDGGQKNVGHHEACWSTKKPPSTHPKNGGKQ